MNSNEEYLDSLLRAAMESDDNDSIGTVEAYREDMLTGVESPESEKEGKNEENTVKDSLSSNPNKALSPEEIEEMLATLENTTTENTEPEDDIVIDKAENGLEDENFMNELENLAFGMDEVKEERHTEELLALEETTFEEDAIESLEEGIAELEAPSFETQEANTELKGVINESDEIDLFAEANFMDMDIKGNIETTEYVKTDSEDGLLESFAIEDEELAEINELLKQSEHDAMMEDDMLAMLEKASSEHDSIAVDDDNFDFFQESEEEEAADSLEKEMTEAIEEEEDSKKSKKKEKKKKEKKWFFSKKKKEEIVENDQKLTQEEQQELRSSEEKGEQSFNEDEQEMLDLFGQFSSDDSGFGDDFFSQFEDDKEMVLPMDDHEETEGQNTNTKEEKQAKGFFGRLFEWLTEEEEEITEKPKKEKKKKAKIAKNENEEIISELEEEDENAEKKKKKKAKKVRKEKKQKIEDSTVKNEKKLPTKMVIRIFALCLSVLLLIVLISNGLLTFVSLKQARSAFYDKDYASAYENMLGTKLNESDSIILEKATLVLRLERKYESYVNYMNMDNSVYALHALLSGLQLYQELYEEAVSQNITEEFELEKALMVDALENTFGISEQKAFELIALEDAGEYQKALAEIVNDSQAATESGSEE